VPGKLLDGADAMNHDVVQSFYERMPYPAPLTNLDGYLASFKSAERCRIRPLLMFPSGAPDGRQSILVAGCGTSQAAKVALREPDADVVAIDISDASLRHLQALQQKYTLDNLEIRQLSLLDARSLDRAFDQIVCTGVLHHLPDPDAGLRCLRDVLKPYGAMQIMVYARYGRSGIYMMQEYCRRLGIGTSDGELADLADVLKQLPNDHPLGWMLHRFRDFTQPGAIADALLHPQDRAYTVPEVHSWLDRCGMTFGRWLEQAPYLPQCGAIAQTPHAARLRALPEAEQHAAVELFRGVMTHHEFVAYRDDRRLPAQPVRFSVEAWRSYIPVRLPWTKRIRERLPAGTAAVLLNPVHKHTDLVLAIDALEDSLLSQIDGTRSLGDIVHERLGNNAVQRALQFFRKLWEYDQIVIDASGQDAVSVQTGQAC
jgi:SAM-dependent methyltransferase